MKKAIILLFLAVAGCAKPQITEDLSGQIGKVWKARQVKEHNTVVYTEGAAGNLRQTYVRFRLDLSVPKVVTLTEVNGDVIKGTWTFSTDQKRLILQSLNPKPTGSDGSVEYFIVKGPAGSELGLTRLTESRKTGNSLNEYDLVPAE